MYEVQSSEYNPVNFLAGDFPVVTETGAIKTGAIITKHMPLILGDAGLEPATAAGIAALQLAGIAADEPTGDEVIYYLTGEFFGSALKLPEGVTLELLKPAFRKLGIFIR